MERVEESDEVYVLSLPDSDASAKIRGRRLDVKSLLDVPARMGSSCGSRCWDAAFPASAA